VDSTRRPSRTRGEHLRAQPRPPSNGNRHDPRYLAQARLAAFTLGFDDIEFRALSV